MAYVSGHFFKNIYNTFILAFCLILFTALWLPIHTKALDNPQTEGVGLQATINTPPPSQAATIASPANGAVFTTLPITVSGFCPSDTLVKIFKNNVFSGSAACVNNSYSIDIDLFSGQNDIIARVYDQLDQAGPDSNTTTVTFNDTVSPISFVQRVSLTSNYARRGANPGQELTWPIIISGGTAPYAVTVDWGDGSSNDIYTVVFPGEFTIKHVFAQAGQYRAFIKAADRNGVMAYLQLTAIGNGEIKSSNNDSTNQQAAKQAVVVWQPMLVSILLIAVAFWLGKRYERRRVKEKLIHGEHPFES